VSAAALLTTCLLLPAVAMAAGDAAGDAARGAALVANRSQSLCTLCHAVPGQPAHLQGDIGPPLAGVGARLSAAELRQRLLDPQAVQPDSVMPAYGRSSGLQQVGEAWRGKPLFTPAQVDDVVAYLAGLK
jgi:sulfur-oxidizing protein SoxX